MHPAQRLEMMSAASPQSNGPCESKALPGKINCLITISSAGETSAFPRFFYLSYQVAINKDKINRHLAKAAVSGRPRIFAFPGKAFRQAKTRGW
jgi:hypothetical protein